MAVKIPFRRVSRDGQHFSLKHANVSIEGDLSLFRPKLLRLCAHMKGPMEVDCYRCGTTFDIIVDEKVEFLLSEGVFRGQDDEYDIVEVHEELIDMDVIFDSEIALIQSDYHACANCKDG